MSTPPSTARYTLEVTIAKTNQKTGGSEHTANVKSQNLTLAETIAMEAPLIDVLGAWVAADAE